MGEMADDLIDQEINSLNQHRRGECDGYCQHCYDEMSPAEKKEFDAYWAQWAQT